MSAGTGDFMMHLREKNPGVQRGQGGEGTGASEGPGFLPSLEGNDVGTKL